MELPIFPIFCLALLLPFACFRLLIILCSTLFLKHRKSMTMKDFPPGDREDIYEALPIDSAPITTSDYVDAPESLHGSPVSGLHLVNNVASGHSAIGCGVHVPPFVAIVVENSKADNGGYIACGDSMRRSPRSRMPPLPSSDL